MKSAPTPLTKTLRTLIASLPPRRRTQLLLLLGNQAIRCPQMLYCKT